jgi:hypothetical protein
MYKVLAYIGVIELLEIGIYDTFDEAQDKLMEQLPSDSDDWEAFHFNSRIEEI